MFSRGTGYVEEPKRPNREPITQIQCSNFKEYSENLSGLKRDGFKMPRTPVELTPEISRRLQDLVNEGCEVVTLPHFDQDGHRINGEIEIYARHYNG